MIFARFQGFADHPHRAQGDNMLIRDFRARLEGWRAASVFAAVLLLGSTIGAQSDTEAQVTPNYSIGWHVITAGGIQRLRNSCYLVSGSIGQTTPGISYGGAYTLYAGFWVAAPISGQDQLFFTGFEGCK